MRDFLDKVAALAATGEPFATATVVARRAPVSAHLGDRAIIHADGRMDGFVGGACSREIIRRQALEALAARQARLVSIRPDAATANSSDPEHTIVPMTCVSEGAIDVFVEPVIPRRQLVVAGTTPVAEALARTAVSLSWEVVRAVDTSERDDTSTAGARDGYRVVTLDALADVLAVGGADGAVVVASQGHYDEDALEAALRSAANYVGLVASRKRGAGVIDDLKSRGVPRLQTVRYPAGLDLGARTAPEVALSILAEIVKHQPAQARATHASAGTEGQAAVSDASPRAPSRRTSLPLAAAAIDPVCGMSVTIAAAKHTAEHDGTSYYFCCPSCRSRFVQDPAPYLAPRA